MMRLRTCAAVVVILIAGALVGVSQRDEARLWRHRNLGKALFENPATVAQAPEELRRALELTPSSFRDRLNYGISLLRAGKAAEAVPELERAQKQDPRSPYTWFNLGIAFHRMEDRPRSLRQWERMVELAPDEPVSRYNLGLLYLETERGPDALRQFQIAARLGPDLVAPRFRIYTYYMLAGDETNAASAMADFQAAKSRQPQGETEDMEWSYYAELYDPVQARPSTDFGMPAKLVFDERVLPGKWSGIAVTRGGLLAWSDAGVSLFRDGTERVKLADIAGVVTVVPGDFDNDGIDDLCVLTGSGAYLYRNTGERMTLPGGPYRAALWLDFDHDYDLDLFLFGPKPVLLRNTGAAFEDYTAHFPFAAGNAAGAETVRADPDSPAVDLRVRYDGRPPLLYRDRLRGVFEASPQKATPDDSCIDADFDNRGVAERVCRGVEQVAADFDGDGRLDLATRSADGTVRVLWNRTVTKNRFLRVALTGVKNLKTAEQTVVEVKAGDLYRKQTYRGVPLLFGLGERDRVDTVRVTWPNGMVQNQVDEPASRTVTIQEAPRLSSSCPMIFTWSGRAFEFLTDVLGVAPLGASSGDGSYFPVDHDEYVRIPAESLAALDGNYEIRITEELHEVSYLDQVRLFVLDHDPGVEILTNEKFQGPPFPEFRLFGVRRKIRPAGPPSILQADGIYERGFRHDSSGVADLHELTLDFGKAAPAGKALLVLNGWVDWADGSTFFGASQAKRGGLVFPYLQVRDRSGAWKTVIEDMGIPAGKPKAIVVDLSGKFLSESRQIRIVTNLCVYWDEIYLSEDTESPRVTMTAIDESAAELRLRGFSRNVPDPRHERPEIFTYEQWTPRTNWNQTPGMYTRYGDVRELIGAIDDRLVIMGAGDELRLLFPLRDLPPLRDGVRRDFLLLVDGWAKDADPNTAFSQTVEPLPFHGMSRYPYPDGEHFPDDPAHREYRARYNTRPALRFLPRLVSGVRR
jgi:tetratricopeptide (TPR) repeat protein